MEGCRRRHPPTPLGNRSAIPTALRLRRRLRSPERRPSRPEKRDRSPTLQPARGGSISERWSGSLSERCRQSISSHSFLGPSLLSRVSAPETLCSLAPSPQLQQTALWLPRVASSRLAPASCGLYMTPAVATELHCVRRP